MPVLPPPGRPRHRSVRRRLTVLYGSLFTVSGALLLAINGVWSLGIASATARPPAPRPGQPPLARAQARIRVLRYQVTALSDHLHSVQSHDLLIGSMVALGVMAAASVLLGWLVAGRILRPLQAMTAATRQISEHDLHQRLALPGPGDELKDLGDTIDGLLARLQAAFDAQRQFVANASHELRTPLTVARALLEVALADPAVSTATLRSACEEVLEVGQEQERLIEALLTLARSQRGLDQRAPFDLARVARRVLDQRDGRAGEGGPWISADLAPAPAAGDPALAERLVANLADNALSYNRPGGRVEVATGIRDGRAVLRVMNTGPLVPADQVERLLQPFQRPGPDRGQSGGSGLGLSIVAAIARAHGASVSARPGRDGGLCVEVVFAPVTASGPGPTPGRAPALVR